MNQDDINKKEHISFCRDNRQPNQKMAGVWCARTAWFNLKKASTLR